ncbi:cleavage polyadenylation factor subunit [Saccharomycopsis crataegensis]|uniref:Endoribonuclease YSH1 n=1 Tax=Saccharomycopsis crataegensis TaxID=43959 RepID=A0AAV5QLW7_9ASCO|nr:cleavage polyadenylation factor subunit [Saccharomycopsis crataegensis]
MISVDSKSDDNESLRFFCLGGGNEVGRSCHIIEFKGKTVMFDAGVHPGFSGLNALPFYDEYDLSKVDILLISHFHLDHAASLPYVMQHTNFKGRVFMTHPTKAIFRWILGDFVRITSIGEGVSATVYNDDDLADAFDRIETIDYHSTLEIDGIKFTAYHAGHVLGAAMFFVEIGGLKVLFTGDYSRVKDRHLYSAEVPPEKPDVLICESTFGIATFENREEAENRLTRLVHGAVSNGGRVLLPTFALGRAQELMLVLDEYWSENPDLENIEIYFCSALARKCMTVYKTYVNMMNEEIRRRFKTENMNPFNFKYIKTLRSLESFEDFGPCVVIASPGMLQNGTSRELLERWAPDPRNALIITGYSVEGTMAKTILTEPLEIPSSNNPDIMIPRRLSVDEISFAAHVDYEQNSQFIDLVSPKNIILVHGEINPMGRLKSALLSKYAKFRKTKREVKVFTPRNCDDLRIQFQGMRVAKALGNIAEVKPKPGDIMTGVLVSKNFDLNLLKVDDLREFSGLTTTVVKERQTIRITSGRDLMHWHLSQMFGYVEVLHDNEEEFELKVMNDVTLTLEKDICTIQWTSGLINDTIADSVIAILLSVDSSPASVKMTSRIHSHDHNHDHNHDGEVKVEVKTEEVKEKEKDIKQKLLERHGDSSIETRVHRIIGLLRAQFGESFSTNSERTGGIVKIGPTEAKINFMDLTAECSSNILKIRIEQIMNRATDLAAPLAQKTKVM